MGAREVVVYIASGEEFVKEAERSAASHSYNSIMIEPERISEFWYLDFVRTMKTLFEIPSVANYDKFLLLDTDTFVCGDLADFFTVLNRFDIAGTQAIGRETMVQRNDIPLSFPELHIGALAFNRNDKVKSLFNLWYEIYKNNLDYYGNNDQGPLRQALWEYQDIQLATLPLEFCFRYRWGGLVNGEVRILHGRENSTPYEEIAKKVNYKRGIRVFGRRELA